VQEDLSTPASAPWGYIRFYEGPCKGYVGQIYSYGVEPSTGKSYVTINKLWHTGSTVFESADPLEPYLSKFMFEDDDGEVPLGLSITSSSPQTKYVLVHGSKFGGDGKTPVCITVREVLFDVNLTAYNTAATAQIAVARTKLNAAGTITYVEVPTLFARYDGSVPTSGDILGKRKGVAFSPDLANCQSVGGTVYFPRPYVYDSTGIDIFAQTVSASVPLAQFLNDWDYYHLRYGSLHCGSNVKRTPPSNWWLNLE